MIAIQWLFLLIPAVVAGYLWGRWVYRLNCAASCDDLHQRDEQLAAYAVKVDDMQHDEQVLQEASRAKSAFLANISHEIRTPIHAVLGQLQLLEQSSLSDEQFQYMHQARQSSRVLLDLLNNLLDLTKIEAGKMRLETIDFDLHDMLQKVRLGLFALAVNKGLNMQLEISSEVPRFVRGDSMRLTQVLMNLVGNAIKFTQKGEVRIKVGGQNKNAEYQLTFAVEDTGIGLSEEALGRIFQEFSQAEDSTTREFGGSGLGLAIAARLVDMMGGELKVESQLGAGSRFYFDLKLASSDGIPSAVNETPVSLIPLDLDEQNALQGLTILLAEDDPAVQEMTQLLLVQQGAKILLASNGQEAMEMLEECPKVDVVLMDIQMPIMDGYAATRLMKQTPSLKAIPVIAMTANATDDDRQAALAAGMEDFLIKPIDIRQMVQTLIYFGRSQKMAAEKAQQTAKAAPVPLLVEALEGFDLQPAFKRMNNQARIFIATASRFLESSPALVLDIKSTLKAGDFEQASRLFHRLKGSALMLGAVALADFIIEMRAKIDAGEPLDNLDMKIDELDRLIVLTQQGLEKTIGDLQS